MMLGWTRLDRSWVCCVLLTSLILGCKEPIAEPEKTMVPQGNGSKHLETARSDLAEAETQKPLAAEPRPVVTERVVIVDVPPGEEPPPTEMPMVVLSQKHVEQSFVRQGDSWPLGELPDLAGEAKPLSDLLGERLTVVLCWSQDNLYSVAALKDLETLVAKNYGPRGVAVVGINVGDAAEAAAAAVEETGVTYPQLSDADGAYFAKLAEKKLPRLYVLDPTGQVLWFDIEWSRTTRRYLDQAIRYQLETAR